MSPKYLKNVGKMKKKKIIIIYSIYRALIPNGPKALYIIKITTKS